jgi:hypothetical protein
MYLVQVLFPLYDNRGRRLPKKLFDQVSRSLAEEHGGLTAYSRSPAVGLWNSHGKRLQRDDIVVYEVLAPRLNAKIWARRRKVWELAFKQDTILIRASRCRLL